MKIVCKHCKGKGGKYENIGGRLIHFPCNYCKHRGYNYIWEYAIKLLRGK
jgi:hypothetical protein